MIKRKTIFFLTIIIILVLCFPIAAFATDVHLNIYVNGSSAASTVLTTEEYPEMEYGTIPTGYILGDTYGTLSSGSCTINGSSAYFFMFDPDNVNFYKTDFSELLPDDDIIVNLYYTNEEEPAPVVYATKSVELVSDGGNDLTQFPLTFTGKKGAETPIVITKYFTTTETISVELDTSYTWTYTFDGATYNVDFDYTDQVSLEQVEDLEPLEQDDIITIIYQFAAEPGGISNDGISNNSVYTFGPYDVNKEDIYYNEYLQANSVVFVDNDTLQIGIDTFRLGMQYQSGGSTMTRSYTLVQPYYIVIVNYLDEDNNPIFNSTHRSYAGTTDLLGKQQYDLTDVEDFIVTFTDYEFVEAQGGSFPIGEANSDKVINLVFKTLKPEPSSEPSPAPSPSPSPSPQPSPEPSPEPSSEPSANPSPSPGPSSEPSPSTSPEPQNTPGPTPTPIVITEYVEVEKEVEKIVETVIEKIVPEIRYQYVYVPQPSRVIYVSTPDEEVKATPSPKPTTSEPTPTPTPVPVRIVEDDVPLAQADSGKAWALVNLILTILTVVGLIKWKEENNYNIINILIPFVSILVFVFTENTFLPMRLLDKWTILMLILFIAECLFKFVLKTKKDNEEETVN